MSLQTSTTKPVIDPIWGKRWDEQYNYLDSLAAFYGASKAPRMSTFQALVQCLQAFAQKQIDFFIDGFTQGKLEECDQFLPEVALASIIEQIGSDMAVIERAAEQRLRCSQRASDPFCRTLNIGEHLLYEALEPARKAGLLRTETTVLVYLCKSPLVRVIPYAPVVLVGIPHTCTGVYRDFLAIPHEVGHYLYRHGYFWDENENVITGNLPVVILPQGINKWTEAWFEEIFADVYGALVAGPVIGIDFQDLLMTNKTEKFYSDDGDHPAPTLRPHIYNNVIKHSQKEWAIRLHDSWERNLDKREGFLSDDELERVGSGRLRKFERKDRELLMVEKVITIKPEDVHVEPEKPLDIAVDLARRVLLSRVEPQSWPNGLKEPGASDIVQNLYKGFDDFVANLSLNIPIPELSISADGSICVNDQSIEYKKGDTLFQYRVNRTRAKLDEVDKIPCQDWLQVLAAGGWATKGPQCETSSGVCG